MIWLVCGSILPSALVTWIATAFVLRGAKRFGLVDQPGHRKVHVNPTPLGGGIAIWLGIMIPIAIGHLLVWRLAAAGESGSGGESWMGLPAARYALPHLGGMIQQAPRLWFLLGAATILMALGLVDDLRGLDWRFRIAVQTAIAAAMVWRGFRLTLYLDWPWLTWLVTIAWIVGLINSFNMLDNMDGLAAGVAAIAAAILAAVLLLSPRHASGAPQLFVAGFLLVLFGALLGFLAHNRPPARIFMGDAGSYLLGFSLAMGTIMSTYAGREAPVHAVLVPLLTLAVPLYDMATVIWIRVRSGRSPFVGDKNHFSHRLVELGMSKPQAVATIYLTTATCGLGAFLLNQVDLTGAVLTLLQVTCVLLIIAVLEITARRKRRS